MSWSVTAVLLSSSWAELFCPESLKTGERFWLEAAILLLHSPFKTELVSSASIMSLNSLASGHFVSSDLGLVFSAASFVPVGGIWSDSNGTDFASLCAHIRKHVKIVDYHVIRSKYRLSNLLFITAKNSFTSTSIIRIERIVGRGDCASERSHRYPSLTILGKD